VTDMHLQPRIPGRGTLDLSHRMLVDGVFEGGGALGAAFSGALRVLEDDGVWFARVAGTSAGAITAALIAAGYTAKEIDWLMSAHGNAGPLPASLREVDPDPHPIQFLSFLDPLADAGSISVPGMRRTLLHRLLRGEIINRFLEQELPVPRRSDVIDKVIEELQERPVLRGMVPVVRDLLDGALQFLNDRPTRLKDLSPWDTRELREELADDIWRFIAHHGTCQGF
jgi:predicted acylesterase/phospholipase RssA